MLRCGLLRLSVENEPSVLWQQVRGAKRKGYRMRKQQERLKLRKLQPRQLEPPKRSWLDRIMLKKSKGLVPVSKLYPSRLDEDSAQQILEEPEDDVWIEDFYPRKVYPISQALAMHREQMHPTIFNAPSAIIQLRLDLNMNLEKKTKFVEDSTNMHSLPHPFATVAPRNVVAFVKDLEQSRQAIDAGAEAAGGPDLVRQITRGQFTLESIDYVVCHLDMISDIGPLRGILKKRYPTKDNGALGLDMPLLVRHFRHGILYDVKRDVETPQFGVCTLNIGKLDMEDSQIEANISSIIKSICQLRPLTEKLGHFIHRAVLLSPLTREYFRIPFWDYAPPLPQKKVEERLAI